MIKRQDGKPVRKTFEEMCGEELSEIDLAALTKEELEEFMYYFEQAPALPTL
jgi:hypothetical protein